ncbi:MAG TPA: copper oxidase [Solimonas sp.]|nr:copper oxidase [Solimonas sp.]
MFTRRNLLHLLGMGGAGLAAGATTRALAQHEGMQMPMPPPPAPAPASAAPAAQSPDAVQRHPQGYVPVYTPNGWTLPYEMKAGVKEFHLVAEEIEHEFGPGCRARCWGYNGTTPGPTIEAVEGDRLRIYVTNRLQEPTNVHWHGILLPNGMDGVGGLTQPNIKPGETFVYEFTLRQHGTHKYHPHADEMVQMANGMMGMFIIHPRDGEQVRIDRDFTIMLHNWALHPGTYRPDPSIMQDFDLWTFNSKVFPATQNLVARTGERVRVRLTNLSMWNHPIHMHGVQFEVTGSDGGRWRRELWRPETTEIVGVGQARDIEFVGVPGDWAFHCHMSHHTMNAMGHGIPNPIGVDQSGVEGEIRKMLPGYMAMGANGMSEHAGHVAMGLQGPENTLPMMMGQGPFGPIEMGGMFTVVKVRDHVAAGDFRDPGWYRHPQGSVARRVSTNPDFGKPARRAPYGAAPATVNPEMPRMDHSMHGG